MKENIFGKRLSLARERMGLSRSELADRIYYSGSTIRDYESGKRDPVLDTIPVLAGALHTTSDYLLGMTELTAASAEEKLICQAIGISPAAVGYLKSMQQWEKRKLEGIIAVLSEDFNETD